jgi:hypothetical protein
MYGHTYVEAVIPESSIQRVQIQAIVMQLCEIRVVKTSEAVVEDGYVGISAFVFASYNDTIGKESQLPGTEFQVPDDVPVTRYNHSFIVLHCVRPGRIDVVVTYENLTKNVAVDVEPALVLLSPTELRLPPLQSYQISSSLPCHFESDDPSVASVGENGIIKSHRRAGTTIVLVKHKRQFQTVSVTVSSPTHLEINKVGPGDFHLLLLNEFGLPFTSLSDVSFEFQQTGLNFTRVAADLYRWDSRGGGGDVRITVKASNAAFSLEASGTFHLSHGIEPSGFSILEKTSYELKCSSQAPNWSSSNPSVLSVDAGGTVLARSRGTVRVSCDSELRTDVRVVSLRGFEKVWQNELGFQFRPVFSTVGGDVVHQVVVDAEIRHFRECARVRVVRDFCYVDVVDAEYCPAVLDVKLTAADRKVSTAVEFAFSGIDFGIPAVFYVTFTETRLRQRVPLKFNQSDVVVQGLPRGLSIDWTNPGFLLTAGPGLAQQGSFMIRHKRTERQTVVRVVRDTEIQGELAHSRRREMWFYAMLVGSFGAVFLVLFT